MASREVIGIMDEFGWDVENICQELIDERRMREALDDRVEEKDNQIHKLQQEIEEFEKVIEDKDDEIRNLEYNERIRR